MSDLNITPKVVDLSHYDDLQDIGKVKAAGIVGIVNKASEGPVNVDRTFAIRRPVVLGAGLLYGAYHFLRPGDMRAQARHFLDVVGDPTGLLLMADWEVPGVPPSDLRIWLQAVRDQVGRWPVVYSYGSMLIEQLGTSRPDPLLAQTRLWLAAYTGNPHWPAQIWTRPWLWQFTGDGSGPGVHQIPGIVLPGSKGIDVDAYEGGDAHGTDVSDDALRAEWAADAGAAPAVAGPDVEPVVDKPAPPKEDPDDPAVKLAAQQTPRWPPERPAPSLYVVPPPGQKQDGET